MRHITVTEANIIPFPVSWHRHRGARRVKRSSSLPNFRVCTGERRKVTSPHRESLDAAFGFSWNAPLMVEFDDPKVIGKRDVNLEYLEHDGKLWKMIWMDRSRTPGKKTYGLRRSA